MFHTDAKGIRPGRELMAICTSVVRNVRASDDAPFSALAFKIMSDPFVGHVTYIRVYSGVLKSGSYVYNSGKATREPRKMRRRLSCRQVQC